MVGAPAREEEQARLTGARADFVSSLPRRLEILRASLRKLEQGPRDPSQLNGLLRRLHALGSAARVLGFASVAEALAEAERVLRRAPRPGPGPAELSEVARSLDLLPSLVLGAPAVLRGASPDAAAAETSFGRAWPLSLVIFGPEGLLDAVIADGALEVECERTEDPAKARELARVVGPDVIIIDVDRRGARELVEQLTRDPLVEPVPILVIGDFANPEVASSFVAAGASRVLPKPVSPDTLARTLLELHEQAPQARQTREPLGDISVAELADRLAAEIRRGLVDAAEPAARATSVGLGEGADVMAAVWGAVARVRDLVTVRSGGAVRFEATGPEGAVPFAAWGVDERRAGDRGTRQPREAEGIPLQGRRVVVADDDPAVVWFLSGLLGAVGAEVLEAHDGEHALELACDAWPDLVVSDVLMPKLDGFSLCHEIKRDVAIRDVPVILLSWKEDLLQRVRELGAHADGYLRKEAAASTVVERLREVLRPRARVEERLSSGGEVRGRLDGLTPRLVLELACRGKRDVRIGIRDAAYLYEVQVREGRLRSVTRSSSDGSFERGTAVLAALLGVSAGRFVVESDASSCRSDFQGSLAAILSGPIAAARAAQRAVSAAALVRVERVDLASDKIQGYLQCTPEPARGLLAEIMGGASPRDLITSARVASGLLETVLTDFARRGAIRSVTRDGGEVVDFDAIAKAKATPSIPPEPAPELENEPPPPPSSFGAGRTPELAPVEAAPPAEAEPLQPEPAPADAAIAAPATTTILEAPDLSDWEVPADFLNVLASHPNPQLSRKAESKQATPRPAPAQPSGAGSDPDDGWFGFEVEPSDAPLVTALPVEPPVETPPVETLAAASPLPFSAEPTPAFTQSDPPRGAFAADVEVGTLRGVGPVPVRPIRPSQATRPGPERPRIAITADSDDALTAVLTADSPLPTNTLMGATAPEFLSPTDALDVVLGVGAGLNKTLPLAATAKPVLNQTLPLAPDAAAVPVGVSELRASGVGTQVIEAVTLPEPALAQEAAPKEASPPKEGAAAKPPAATPSKRPSHSRLAPGTRAPATPSQGGASVPQRLSNPGSGGVWRTVAVALVAGMASFSFVRWVIWPILYPPAPEAAELTPAVAAPPAVPSAPALAAPSEAPSEAPATSASQ